MGLFNTIHMQALLHLLEFRIIASAGGMRLLHSRDWIQRVPTVWTLGHDSRRPPTPPLATLPPCMRLHSFENGLMRTYGMDTRAREVLLLYLRQPYPRRTHD
jgi:hypothetical protein